MSDLLTPLLSQILRITTTDDRIFLGMFAGTDQPLNLVLVNAEEFRLVHAYTDTDDVEHDDDSELDKEVRYAHATEMRLENEDGRYVGTILIPWKKVVKVEVSAAGQYDEEESERYT